MKRPPHIRSLMRGLAVLETFADGQPRTRIEISKATGLPYASAWRVLMTLIDGGFVETLPGTERYCPTGRTLSLSAGFHDRANLIGRFRSALDEACRELSWPLALALPTGDKMVVRYCTHSYTSMTYTTIQPGFATPLGHSATGIAYLAALAEDKRALLVEGLRLPRLDAEILHDRIRESARTGFAAYERTKFNATPGKTSTIAVPVRDGGEAVGALALTIFAGAMPIQSAIERYIPRLTALAAIL